MKTKIIATNASTSVKQLPQNASAENKKNDPQPMATNPQMDKQEREIIALLNPTAEQRLKNLKNFQLLSERFETLKEKQDELNAFTISSDGTQEKFKLSNSSGRFFEFTNSQVIEDVIAVVSNHLSVRIERTEKEILEFTI